MELYTFFRSSTSFRLRIALAYKGIAYEPRFVSLPKMEHHAADYLAKNPQGLVPALVDDAGRVFTQSMAMIEYLDDLHPEPPLMPKSAQDKWYVRAVSQIIGCEMHPLNNVRVLKYLRSRWKLSEGESNEWYAHWIAEGFRAIEAFIKQEGRAGAYCLGERFTIADICLAPQVFNAQRFNCDLAAYPVSVAVAERVMQLPAVVKAHPKEQGDAF